MVSGVSKIDVEDWRRHTRLKACSARTPVVQWFWRAVTQFDDERKSRLLQFVTGSFRVPVHGFRELRGQSVKRYIYLDCHITSSFSNNNNIMIMIMIICSINSSSSSSSRPNSSSCCCCCYCCCSIKLCIFKLENTKKIFGGGTPPPQTHIQWTEIRPSSLHSTPLVASGYSTACSPRSTSTL